MAIIDYALEHASQGRLVFPGKANSKVPDVLDPYGMATTDERQIITWWQENPNRNICLPAGYEVSPGKYLGIVDVDFKETPDGGFRDGIQMLAQLDVLGCEFPETLAQTTPTGGMHFFYYFDFPIRNGVNSIGIGIDTRGYHGYVIGAGSGLNGKTYRFKNHLPIVWAPTWLAEKLRASLPRPSVPELGKLFVINDVQQETAARKSRDFLQKLEPAQAGARNQKAYEAACRLKDFGLLREYTFQLMSSEWKSEPALEYRELEHVVNSAYSYGQNQFGVLSPEALFTPVVEPAKPILEPVSTTLSQPEAPKEPVPKPKDPIESVNDSFAFVTMGNGCRILWESTFDDGRYRCEHLSIQAFHEKLANRTLITDSHTYKISKLWIASKQRREYDGIIFAPNRESKRFYNTWRGFTVSPRLEKPDPRAEDSLKFFLEHITGNVCRGDENHAKWVLGFFAHLIQKPEEKPGVALVLRGGKGVGKNAITDCISPLLGNHYLLAANRRYLSGNFNSHLENNICLVLDEAFWSGDKTSEGILKDMVTGSKHLIERKGYEPYTVANLTRLIMFGNEDWVVPASIDERRFAVFDVSKQRQNDRKFFGAMKDGLKLGGDRVLFDYLNSFDLSQVDINVAPSTDALVAQKEHSLGPVESWWLSCLKGGHIIGSSIDGWPKEISCTQFRSAFLDEMKAQNVRSRLPNDSYFGRSLRAFGPSIRRKLKREGELRFWIYDMGTIETARAEFESFLKGKIDWEIE